MKAHGLRPATVPISYVRLLLDILQHKGIAREDILSGLHISEALLDDPDGRISLLDDYARLCQRALRATGEPGLAYEFGLRSTLTTHGIVGYGLMSQPTLRHVLDFAERFGSVLRMPAWELSFACQGEYARMEGREAISHGVMRKFSAQQLLVSCYSILTHLLPSAQTDIELLFDFDEPSYHARFAHRMPRCHFNTGVTQIRLLACHLDTPLKTADTISAKLAERECERELALQGPMRDVLREVRALLVLNQDGYPDLQGVASILCLSPRTLTRQLQERGTSFRELMQLAQARDSHTLLRDPRLTLSDVAHRLGYSSLANFARAFRAWQGMSPGEYRGSLNPEDAKAAA